MTEIEIKHPLSVIDGTKIKLKDAFSWILHYYSQHKGTTQVSCVLDTTCSEMLMWNDNDKKEFVVQTNDIRPEIEADYHVCCSKLTSSTNRVFDMLIYDPPYIDLENRQDSEKYETAFNYGSMKELKDLEQLTRQSSPCFWKLLNKNGVLIVKITNFHLDKQLHGSFDMINWFSDYFYLFDEVIYRFFKHIPNLNWYKRKVAVTHSYFLIFKRKQVGGKKLW